ncbi:MAG: hypothetical protein JXR84_08500 [Anaerolineae bacterium]|nr:hypothetical protein [Anaerolineae bacterium]
MTINADPSRLWQAALGELELQMTQATFDTWLRNTQCVGYDDDDTLVIAVKNGYAVEWLENRLYPVIARTLHRLTDNGTEARFIIEERAPRQARAADSATAEATEDSSDTVGVLATILRQVIDPATRKLLQEQIAAMQGVYPEPEEEVDTPQLDTYAKGGGGWYPLSNYADTFWKPFLKKKKAFLVYTTLRALDKNAAGREWTQMQHVPIREIMQRVPCSRHTILGVTRKGEYQPGALDILRAEGIARVEAHGEDKHTTYYVSVIVKLPLLTPSQVRHLSDELQAQHRDFLIQHSIDPTPWEP